MKNRIVITGSTGLIASHLVKQLKGYELTMLTRTPDKYTSTESIKYVYWDGKNTISEILEDSYAIINLIGENIGHKNWSSHQKELILNSRIDAAQAISNSIELCKKKPQVWIQGSATGFYGQSQNVVFDEFSPKGENSFLAEVCQEWERPIRNLNTDSLRKIVIRTGVVLAKNSDLWKQLNQSFLFRVAAVVGNGKQILPWIHIEDEVEAILFLLENENLSGTFNLVAPIRTSMNEVVLAMKKYKKSFLTIFIPQWFLNLIFGKDKTEELVLTNQNVIPRNLLRAKFEFKYRCIVDVVENFETNTTT